jgi:hypothetical protein
LFVAGCGGGGGTTTPDFDTYALLSVEIDGKANPQVVIGDGNHYIFEASVANTGTVDAKQVYVKVEYKELNSNMQVTSTQVVATGYIDVPKGQKITLKPIDLVIGGTPYFDVVVSASHNGTTSTATTNGVVLAFNG